MSGLGVGFGFGCALVILSLRDFWVVCNLVLRCCGDLQLPCLFLGFGYLFCAFGWLFDLVVALSEIAWMVIALLCCRLLL